jgi:RNA recognition motif-containing protein
MLITIQGTCLSDARSYSDLQAPQSWGQEALPQRNKSGSGRSDLKPLDIAKSVHVNNLPFRSSEEDLAMLFGKCGSVVRSAHGH